MPQLPTRRALRTHPSSELSRPAGGEPFASSFRLPVGSRPSASRLSQDSAITLQKRISPRLFTPTFQRRLQLSITTGCHPHLSRSKHHLRPEPLPLPRGVCYSLAI